MTALTTQPEQVTIERSSADDFLALCGRLAVDGRLDVTLVAKRLGVGMGFVERLLGDLRWRRGRKAVPWKWERGPERRKAKKKRPTPFVPEGQLDQTIAAARSLAKPDGRVSISEIAAALGLSESAIRSRRERIILTRGAAAWPRYSPSCRHYDVNGDAPYREPLASDLSEGWEERKAGIDVEVKTLEVDTRCDAPGGVYRPMRGHTPNRAPFRGPPSALLTGDALRMACRALIREWRALKRTRRVYGPAERDRDLAAMAERRTRAGRAEDGWGNRAAV